MKLFLYSTYAMSDKHRAALSELVGKPNENITFAAIPNAIDVVEDAREWFGDCLASLGGVVEEVDLRNYRGNLPALREKLASKDVIWVSAGNGFYLSWLLKDTGAAEIIRELAQGGQVYAGWGGGGVIAGPSLEFFQETEDNMAVVPELVTQGLGLTQLIPVPHMDLGEFAGQMQKINANLKAAGFTTVPLNEDQALVINGENQKVI